MSTGAAAAAAAAATAQAIKASGVLVTVAPEDFLSLVQRQRDALVVHAQGGIVWTNYQYLMGYKGLAFFTKSPEPLTLPAGTEVMQAKSIWIPG
jgi:hypothetical protein